MYISEYLSIKYIDKYVYNAGLQLNRWSDIYIILLTVVYNQNNLGFKLFSSKLDVGSYT